MMHDSHKGLSKDEIVAYLRKSRSDDVLLTVEEVLAKHEQLLDEWTERNIGEKLDESHKLREVVSGETIDDRPEMLKLLKLIENPRIKAVLVVEVQRLSRGDLEDAGRLIKILRYTNTLVITPQKTYDLQDEYDRDFFERELKRGNEFLEYQKKILNRGRILSVQQGNYLGSSPPYGYNRVFVMDGKKKCPTLEINEREAEVVRMIFDLYVNENLGHTTIATRLGKMGIKPPKKGKYWSPGALRDLLQNIHYIGKVKWNWRKTINVIENGEVKQTRPKSDDALICDGRHPAIIDEALFYAAQERHGRNAKPPGEKILRNPFAGLIYCQCGCAMTLHTFTVKGKARAKSRLVCPRQAHCGTSSSFYDDILQRVSATLKECIADFEINLSGDNKEAQKRHADIIKNLEKKLEELDAKEVKLWDMYAEDQMPKKIFDKLKAELFQDREKATASLSEAQKSAPTPIDYEKKIRTFRDALNTLNDEEATALQKNALLKKCIERVDYSRGKLTRGGKTEEAKRNEPPIHLDFKLRV